MKEINNHHKNDLIVLDFDGAIYLNPNNDLSMNIKMDHILPAHEFFFQLNAQVKLFNAYDFAHHTLFFLLTRRSSRQERLILSLLRKKGFRIKESFFSNYKYNLSRLRTLTNESNFYLKYWSGKVSLINKLRHSNKFNSITVIDHDNVICTMSARLGFNVIHSQITQNRNQLFIQFTPLDGNSNYNRFGEVMMYG